MVSSMRYFVSLNAKIAARCVDWPQVRHQIPRATLLAHTNAKAELNAAYKWWLE